MSTLSSKDKKFYGVVAITLIIMIGFGYLPTFGQITPQGMRVLGIFLGCIFAWLFGELVWSSVIGLVLLGVFGFGTMTDNYARAYGNNIGAIMLVSLIFCYAIEKSGLLTELSRWIVSRKWAQKSPWSLVLAFNLAALISATMLGTTIPVMILLWALFYEIANEIGIKPFDPLAVIVLCGVAVSSSVGNVIMPYTGTPTLVRGLAEASNPDFMFNTGEYILLNFLVAAIFLVLFSLVLRLVFGRKIHIEMPQRESYKMKLNVESKISLVFFIIVILTLIVPQFLNADNIIRVFFNDKLTVVGIFMIISAILMIIRINGKPLLDIPAALAGAPWPLFLLVTAALTISDYLTTDEMGIVSTIVASLNPLLAGRSAFEVTLIFIVIGLVMTNFINDMVTIMVLFPIAAQFILDANGSVMILAILFSQVCIQGCLMPSGSITGAMMHGNNEWMTSKQVFTYVFIMEVVVLITIISVAFLGKFIGIS